MLDLSEYMAHKLGHISGILGTIGSIKICINSSLVVVCKGRGDGSIYGSIIGSIPIYSGLLFSLEFSCITDCII